LLRHFLRISDLSKDELESLFKRASKLKAEKKAGRMSDSLKGKSIGLVFEKLSTRTRGGDKRYPIHPGFCPPTWTA
jgi:ornithine carbamoyltransferase